MIQLALLFCLAASATTCKTVVPPFQQGYPSLLACNVAGQFVAIEMLRDRLDLQGWRLARWRCGPAQPPGTAL